MIGNAEILIVDDTPGASKDFGALIASRYNFSIATTETPDEAIEIIKNNNIKVVVLDQKMPLMKGTELFKKIIEINPIVKALMLTAEANPQEVSDAYGAGYHGFLDKTKISALPDKVYDLYTKFEIDYNRQFQINNCPSILSEKSGFFSRHTIDYYILNIQSISTIYIFDDKWQTVLEIHSGQTIEYEEIITIEEEITVNQEFEEKIKAEFGLSDKSLGILKANFSNEINKKLSYKKSNKISHEKRNKMNFSLPAEPTDLSENYIVKRIIEQCPVYIEYRAVICKRCSFCNKYEMLPIVFYKQTNKIASRQKNILKDQTTSVIDTGITQHSLP